MKHKSILSLLIFLMGLSVTTTSCEDMLTPDMNRYAENFSGTDTVYFYLGIMRNVQDMVEQNQLLGDLRSDLVATTPYSSDSVSHIIDIDRTTDKDADNQLINRAAYYKVINQCNYYLAKVDTSVVKNNIYYMKREYAQVVNVRAWTYLQLVQTYGKVPFITKPVDNADTGWEKNPETWATADNLVDLLKGDLEKAQVIERTMGYPNYGEFQTGNDNFKVQSNKMLFYADVILGDLYLLRSNGKADYVAAAKNYYYFLKEKAKKGIGVSSGAATFSENTNPNGTKFYTASVSSWVSSGLAPTTLGNENITIIPSAANNTFGRVLTRTAQIYGFDASSSNTTSSNVSGSSVSTSGSVNIWINYKSRQVEPSNAYLQLCAAQPYARTTITNGEMTEVKYYEGAGDARLWATAPYFNTKDAPDSKARFITKDATIDNVSRDGIAAGPQFKHYKSIYRLRQIYLRYAEAINRAGYPRMAYAVLTNGLSKYTIPEISSDSIKYDDENRTFQHVFYVDSASITDRYRGAFFIGTDELRRAQDDPEYDLYLNFTSSNWNNVGIHQLGGMANVSLIDSLNGYDKRVAQRIEDEALRTGTANTESVRRAIRKLHAEAAAADGETGEGGDAEEPTLDELRKNYDEIEPEPAKDADPLEIRAVESLIADECVLETAYEGSRMFDLIRFARHMNNDSGLSADYGTQWLAWKIARRAVNLAPYAQPNQYDASLYGKMLNSDNWYIANPEYK